jgi:hypothetical protein
MKTLSLDVHQFNSLYWEVNYSLLKWSDTIQECKNGLRPNMSLEGAESIYNDLLEIRSQMKELECN